MSLKMLNCSIDIVENKDKTKLNKTKRQGVNTRKNKHSAKKEFTVVASGSGKGKKTVEDIKNELSADKGMTERNIQRLLSLSSQNVVKASDAEKIMKHTHKDEAKIMIVQKTEESIFTEEDFDAFEREYTL